GQVRGDEPDPLQQLGRRRLSAPRGRAHRADGALPAQPRRVDQGAQFRRAGHRRWLRPAARACRAHSPAARPSPLTATFALRRPLWAVLPSPGTSAAGATMNPSTLIGMLASIALLSVVMLFAAEDPALFIDLPSLGIVLVGTLAATFISYPLREVARVFGLLHTVLRNERLYIRQDLDELVQISRLWIEGELPAVERALEKVSNPFLRTGVQLVIDNTP